MPERTCSIEGCDRTGRMTRGMCDKHYKRAARTGLSPQPKRKCAVGGCPRPHRARGYCKLHYRSIWWPIHRPQIPRPCATCGRTFTPDPGSGSRDVKACSNRCRGKAGSGEAHWNWRGGVTPEHVRIRTSPEYVAWRRQVFERDGFACVDCGTRGDIEADHIKPFAFFPDLRFDAANGRTLCVPCHKATPTYGRRAFEWA